jgi:hypothetical protein
MPVLFVPTLDALRLALASGLVPGAVALAPGRATIDAHGHHWLEPDDQPTREDLTALNRLGVVALGSPGALMRPVRSWAELLPLRRGGENQNGRVLFDVPDRELAQFVARLRRGGATLIGVRLLPDPHDGRAWVTVVAPPPAVLIRVDEPDSPIRSFHQQAVAVWTARGWEHPLASHLAVPPESVLLCSPAGTECVAGAVPDTRLDEYTLPVRAGAPKVPHPIARIDVRFRLARCDAPRDESLWVLGPAGFDAFGRFCRAADERLLRRFQLAVVQTGGEARVLVRRAVGADRTALLPVPAAAFRADPRLPSLYIPTGFSLRPVLRTHEAARALSLGEDRLVWVEAAGRGIAVHAVAGSVFRPLHEQIEYAAPPSAPLTAVTPPEETLPFARFALQVETTIDLDPEPELAEPGEPPEPLPVGTAAEHQPGWVAKSVARMVDWVRGRRLSSGSGTTPAPAPRPTAQREDEDESRAARVERKLASADALVHGHDRTGRRRELESRLLADFSRLGADERAARWAELAGVYATTGQALDAAVCWTNALWECPTPPEPWLEQWAVAEVRAANRPERGADLDRWLSEPGRPGTGRVIAALAAYFGVQPAVPSEFVSALPRVLAVLDQQFDDIPVRAGWLARLAAARSSDGDVLGLARWHDRLIRRLHDRGPGLDLDEPSFLRFRGTANAERLQKARNWLKRNHDPVIAWVRAHGSGGRLEWAGLSAEITATVEYAQMMLAWGLGVLGERAQSRDWSARARRALALATGARVDPAGHAFLGDLFLHRTKEAHEGHAPKAALPAELQARYEKLPDFARYSVDRLRDHSRILQPVGPARAYRGLDLKEFWGTDRLGERLTVLATRTDPADLHDEARALLAVAAAGPTTATVPRIALALLRVAAALDPPVLAPLFDLVPMALDWGETWVGAGRWKAEERADRVTRFQCRIIESALAVAPPAVAAHLLGVLARGAAAGPLLPAVLETAPAIFRAARKCGLAREADALVRVIDPVSAERADESPTPKRVGLAIGWFAAGDEEAGFRILDAAKEVLFHATDTPVHTRTALALAYAEALGFAPGVIALGRLEELFQPQRRVRVTVHNSSNCYYTLHPLRLIDTVVRSVVTDEFTLGAAVRAWLDEDEFLIRRRIHRDMAAVLRESEVR